MKIFNDLAALVGGKRVTVCGSFRRDIEGLRTLIDLLVLSGSIIMSPRSLDVIEDRRGFVLTAADTIDDVKGIEMRHLDAIASSDLVFVCAPNGVGTSTAFEIGYAVSCGVQIYTLDDLQDEMLNTFITHIV